jgi:hypothetical protein
VYDLAWNTTSLVLGVKNGVIIYTCHDEYEHTTGVPIFSDKPIRTTNHASLVGCVSILDSRIYAGGMDGMLTAYGLFTHHGAIHLKCDFHKKAHDTGVFLFFFLLFVS